MKLIYFTSQKYPSTKADPFFIQSMADAFSKICGNDFLFVVRGAVPDELKNLPVLSVNLPKRFRTMSYFLYLPILIVRNAWSDSEIVFFSSDPYLLATLVFWRKVFRFNYRICSDWHQLFDDWRDRYVATNSDYLISTSQRLKGLLSSVCGVNPNKILVAYGGVDANLFIEKSKIEKSEYRKKLKLPSDVFLVGYIGAFRSVDMEKGLDTMIQALPYLDKKIKMIFVGGSRKHIDEYRVLASKIGVEDQCIFVEKQKPFEKVVEYMLSMDILVIPYPDLHHFRDYGFPMKVWEYMSAGRPILYSNLEIMGEVLNGRANSFIPGDARSLAEAVTAVFNNREGFEIVASHNPSAVQAYTWKARAEHIINFIHQ